MYFYEAAAFDLSCVTAGYGGVQTVHPAKAVMDDGVTPLEARFCAELAHALAGMKADQANELVNRLLEKYEKEVENAPTGKRYQECYDLKTGKPSDDYLRLYEEAKAELASLGITLQ
jgi:methylamine--corrinoid protein Co-methyltransferase